MRGLTAAITGLTLDPSGTVPMYRQIYDALRAAILRGQISPGTRLPPQRDLARELGVSRNTVMMAFEQLAAEGYLEGRVGAGTYVSASLPEDLLQVRERRRISPLTARATTRGLSSGGRAIASIDVSLPSSGAIRPFRIGMPDMAAFPFDEWSRIVGRIWRRPPQELLRYGDPQGYPPLREAIADYVAAARGVQCDPAQVIVTAGSQQALDLVARMLLEPGQRIWIEDPGYLGARAVFTAAGAGLVPVPVDADGLDVAAGEALAPEARVAYVTPSHQFPMGVTMSAARRLALLDRAARHNAWIIEDDYDSEYRYASRPLASLQGMDRRGRVFYIGTFSKVMFPGLRLGYLIVPEATIDAFVRGKAVMDRHAASVDQAAVARFIEEGHFGRHIRRMRALYQERRDLLVDLVRRELRGALEIDVPATGMHTVAWLADGVSDRAASRQAQAAGVDAPPLSAYRLGPSQRGGLLLGFAAYEARGIIDGVRRLAAAFGG